MNIKGFIQSVRTSPWHLILRLRFDGNTSFLYLPRGGKFKDVLCLDVDLANKFRCNDKLREKVKSYTVNWFLNSIKITEGNIHLELFKSGKKQFLNFTYASGRIHVGYFYDGEAFLPYRNKSKIKINEELKIFIDREVKLIRSTDTDNFIPQLIKVDNYEKYINFNNIFLKEEKRISEKYKKKIAAIESDLLKLNEALELQLKLANNEIQIADDTNVINFKSIKLNLKKYTGKYQKINFIFEKCKAYKKAIEIQKNRLEQSRAKNISSIDLRKYLIHQAIQSVEDPNVEKNINVGKTMFLPNGEIFRIGRSIEENIQIRQNWSKKTDFWFHLESISSAHGFLRLNNSILGLEHLDYIGQVFCEVEKRVEVHLIYTQVKYLRSVKGDRGKVVPTQIKYFKYVSKK